jgi:hypothetical protein
MDEIKPYCADVRIKYNGDFYPDFGYVPEMGSFNIANIAGFAGLGGLGGLGMMTDWTLGAYNLYSLSDKYKHAYPYSQSGYGYDRRATLEADVAGDNYEYVREKLYSCGAMTVS